MIDSNTLVSRKLVELLYSVTDNGCSKMSYMEGLCNVWRGIVNNYRLALAKIGRAIAFLLLKYLGKNLANEVFF